MKKHILHIFFYVPFLLYAQPRLLPIENNWLQKYDAVLISKEINFHTASKPYTSSQTKGIFDSIDQQISETRKIIPEIRLLQIEGKNAKFSIIPAMDAVLGYELKQSSIPATLAYGGIVDFSVKQKIHFNAFISQGFTKLPAFLDSIAQKEEVVPGAGSAFNDVKNSLRYWNNSGYISYDAMKYMNLQLGYGRNFIGDGYRSLLLSDHAYSYPYAKITTNIWKVQYVNIFTNFQDIGNTGGDPAKFYNKYGTFHYLSINLTKRLNVGLFEAIIFENRDTTGRRFTYDVNYLNPIIFYRPVEYSMGSADNAVMGLNFKYKLFKKQLLYGQAMIDEFLLKEIKADIAQAVKPDPQRQWGWWANKYGFQAGIKMFDFLWVRNLQFQAEFNLVRPYSYTHSSIQQNYGHFNQPLAHPLGANFKEMISILRYYYNRFSVEAKVTYAKIGNDTDSTYFGRDIFRSYRERPYEYGHRLGQGEALDLLFTQLQFNYLLNIKNNFRFEFGAINRQMLYKSEKQQGFYLYAGIRTSIFNSYYDR